MHCLPNVEGKYISLNSLIVEEKCTFAQLCHRQLMVYPFPFLRRWLLHCKTTSSAECSGTCVHCFAFGELCLHKRVITAPWRLQQSDFQSLLGMCRSLFADMIVQQWFRYHCLSSLLEKKYLLSWFRAGLSSSILKASETRLFELPWWSALEKERCKNALLLLFYFFNGWNVCVD